MNVYRSTRFIYTLRSLSYINISVRSLSCFECNVYSKNYSPLLQNKKPFDTSFLSRRNISLQGFVEWQQNVYATISNSSAVDVIQNGLLKLHETSGLPWWATIVLSTVMLRGFITLPLTIYQNYIMAKVEMAGLELKELLEELKKETAIAKHSFNLTDKQAMQLFKRSLKKQWKNIIERENCHPFKASLVIWLQIPLWVCTSFALRNLVYMQPKADAAATVTFMELSVGGFGWIPNLTIPDASWIFPVAFGVLNLSIIELTNMSKLRPPSRLHKIFTNCFRVFTVVIVPIAATVPSSMCLYWVTSSGFGLLQNIVLLSPKLRRKLGIIETPSELENPYAYISNEMKTKLNKLIPKKFVE